MWTYRRSFEEVKDEYRWAQEKLDLLLQGTQAPEVVNERPIPRWSKTEKKWYTAGGTELSPAFDREIPDFDPVLRQIQYIISQGEEEQAEKYLLDLAASDIFHFKVLRPHLSWYPFPDEGDTRGEPFLDNFLWNICKYFKNTCQRSDSNIRVIPGDGPVNLSRHEFLDGRGRRCVCAYWALYWRSYSTGPDRENVLYPTVRRGFAPNNQCFEDTYLIQIKRYDGCTSWRNFVWNDTVYEVRALVRWRLRGIRNLPETDHPRRVRYNDPHYPFLPDGKCPQRESWRPDPYNAQVWDETRYNFTKAYWLDHSGNLITVNDPGLTILSQAPV